MMTKEELIAALEKAEGPDTELDHAIMLAVAGPPPTGSMWSPDREYTPAYTASIDAALTLVPEHLSWAIKSPGFQSVNKQFTGHLESGDYEYHGFGWTPALALCIAALRARP